MVFLDGVASVVPTFFLISAALVHSIVRGTFLAMSEIQGALEHL